VTSRVAVLGVGAAVLLAANVQTGNIVENYYKGQAGIGACLCTRSKLLYTQINRAALCRWWTEWVQASAQTLSLLAHTIFLATLWWKTLIEFSCKISHPSSTMWSLELMVHLGVWATSSAGMTIRH